VEENYISEWVTSETNIGRQVLSEDEIVNACIENTETEIDSSEDEAIVQINQQVQHMMKQLQCWSSRCLTSRNKVKHFLLSQ